MTVARNDAERNTTHGVFSGYEGLERKHREWSIRGRRAACPFRCLDYDFICLPARSAVI
jgi:hypothetical protein